MAYNQCLFGMFACVLVCRACFIGYCYTNCIGVGFLLARLLLCCVLLLLLPVCSFAVFLSVLLSIALVRLFGVRCFSLTALMYPWIMSIVGYLMSCCFFVLLRLRYIICTVGKLTGRSTYSTKLCTPSNLKLEH